MQKLWKVLWNIIKNPQLKQLVADILDVYADLFRGDLTPEQALEKIVDLVQDFVFQDQ